MVWRGKLCNTRQENTDQIGTHKGNRKNLSQRERARKRVVTASCPKQGIACACKAAIPPRARALHATRCAQVSPAREEPIKSDPITERVVRTEGVSRMLRALLMATSLALAGTPGPAQE